MCEELGCVISFTARHQSIPPATTISPPPQFLSAAGCGQHSPLVAQQQQVLRRRLQQLRSNDAASNQKQPPAGSSSSSSSAGDGGGGGGVGPRELRIGAVYQLGGVSSRDAAIIEKQLVPAAIKVLQKFIQVCVCVWLMRVNEYNKALQGPQQQCACCPPSSAEAHTLIIPLELSSSGAAMALMLAVSCSDWEGG